MQINDDECAREAWKWALHEDTLFQTRSLIFVALQALLFAGIEATYEKILALRYIFVVVGLYVASIWLVAMHRQYSGTLEKIKLSIRQYGEQQPPGNFFHLYYKISADRASSPLPGLNQIIGRIVPLIFILAWLGVLFQTVRHTGLSHN